MDGAMMDGATMDGTMMDGAMVDGAASEETLLDAGVEAEAPVEQTADALLTILHHLRRQTGHDFASYKRSTILRRIGRRQQATGIAELGDYAEHMAQSPEEARALFRDSLISVTNFFRDPQAFHALNNQIVPRLFANQQPGDAVDTAVDTTVRVWVAGCATGEEAYSLAILLHEHADRLPQPPQLQIFATDLDDEAIAVARRGHYPASIAEHVSPERLQRFFVKQENGYLVDAALRDSVLFAVHDLITDPPFSRLDLVACRNLLIYLNREAQEKLFELFHYALLPGRYLFLGTSETADVSNLFAVLDKPHHLFQRREQAVAASGRFSLTSVLDGLNTPAARPATTARTPSTEELYQRRSVRRYAPPRLLLNADYEITHTFSGADKFLRGPEGAFSQNVLHWVLPGLRLELRAALHQAFQRGEPTTSRLLPVEVRGEPTHVRLHVEPVDDPGFPANYVEVVFEEKEEASLIGPPGLDGAAGVFAGNGQDEPTAQLTEELRRTRERLQRIVEDNELSSQELKSSNEALRLLNEELKSTMEELETSTEELQSMNEELTTVNGALEHKIGELHRANSDLFNLIAATDVGVIFLDRALHVQRFTPRTTELFNLIEADIGRPLGHISHHLLQKRLPERAARVLETLEPSEEVVRSEHDRWYIVHMSPYQTTHEATDQAVDGVVITLVDITSLRHAEHEVKLRVQQSAVADLGREALEGTTSESLLALAAERVANALGLPLGAIWSLAADGSQLRLAAGHGWQRGGDQGRFSPASVPVNYASPIGSALRLDEPVVIGDLAREPRLAPDGPLSKHGVVSSLSVVIQGEEGPRGVLSVHGREPREFAGYEVDFVQAVAYLLGEALTRRQTAVALHESEERAQARLAELETIYNTAGVALCVLDRELRYLRINKHLAEINGIPAADHINRTVREIVPDLADEAEAVMRGILETGEPAFDIEISGETPAQPGVVRTWLENWFPLRDANGHILGINVVVEEITERKRSEAALRNGEDRLRRVLDSLAASAAVLTPDGRIVEVNRAALAIADLRMEALRDLPFEQGYWLAHDGELQARIRDSIRRAARGETVRFDIRARIGPAHFLDVDYTIAPVYDSAGEIAYLVPSGFDITERKRAEADLAASEAKFATAFSASPLLLTITSLETGKLLEVNERFIQLSGYAHDEALGRSPVELGLWLNEDEQRPGLERLRRGKSIRNAEVVFRMRDGSLRTCLAGATVVQISGEPCVLTALVDISEQKEAEQALLSSKAELALVTDNVPGLISYVDRDERYTFVNAAYARWFAKPREQIIGHTIREMLGEAAYRSIQPRVQRALAGERVDFETTLDFADGETRTVLATFMPDGNMEQEAESKVEGEAGGFYTLVTDITQRKQAEEQLRKLTDTLEELVQKRTRQVRTLSSALTLAEQRERHRIAQVLHDDLQQLLYGAQIQLGMAEGDLKQALAPAQAEQTLPLLRESNEAILRAISVARTLSVELSPPVLRGEGLFEAICWLASHMRDVHRLEVAVSAEHKVQIVREDLRVLLFHLVRELLFNVVKHAGIDRARVTLDEDAAHIRIVVEDEGRGFDLAETQLEAGTGFGLFSIRERLRLFSGRLEVASAPGSGTRVTILLPTAVARQVADD